jgi:bifunctional non-homologous end joining protein LigD
MKESLIYEATKLSRSVIGKRFLIHEHHAVRVGLHYDLRLERDGTLKSYACRYIPELLTDEKKKILMIQQKDHDITWFDFEGEIKDSYGKGKVIIWDKGIYETVKWTPNSIVINLKGVKAKGVYAMIPYMNKKNQWLMFKTKS